MDIQSMEQLNNLTVSETRILKYLMARIECGDEKIPIREVAQSAYVSTTSVVRLAKKLGFDGFSELLFSLKHERGSSLRRGAPGYCDCLLSGKGRESLDMLAAELISGKYDRVHVMGVGYSDLVASYLSNRLQELGFFATTKSPLDFRDERRYLLVFVSERGETYDLTFVQERCRAKGISDWVFTAEASSTLGSGAEHLMVVERRGRRNGKESDYFVINCLTLIEDLAATIRLARKERGEL